MKYTLITLAALSNAAFAQTIVNGDFSDTSGMTEGTYNGGGYFNGVPNGWTSNNGDVTVVTLSYQGGNTPGFSSSFVDILAESQPVTLSQQVSGFTVGQQYTLSYDWGNRDSAYDMTISMGGASDSHKGSGLVAATSNSFTFTAGAATETLSLAYNATNGTTWSGFNSTNFKVTPVNPVPEPSSAALLGLGGLALILRRRK